MFKTIEQERAEAEAMVKGMNVIGSIRRLECSGYISPWDDPDMDTTETLYQNENGVYYMRVEQYHEFMMADDVYRLSRKGAENWIRENIRNTWTARKRLRMATRCYLNRYGDFTNYSRITRGLIREHKNVRNYD